MAWCGPHHQINVLLYVNYNAVGATVVLVDPVDDMTRAKPSKRAADTSATPSSKKAKTAVARGTDVSESSAPDTVKTLLGGMSFEDFRRDYFEQQPLLLRKPEGRDLFPAGLFSRAELLRLAAAHELEHSKDMTMCRFVDNERENFVPSNSNTRATKKNVAGLLDKKYSCQFYQPQRYVDGLYRLNAAFEELFGCLAGASAYLTPPSAQALAPHHDDVDVFILQTEGRKKWKLYKPLVELAGEHSSDLDSADIGDVWQEFTLDEGDMLYFPRGVIHQASTDADAFSTHVTISVYQHTSWANFLEVSLPRIIRRAFDSDVAFRRGLPVGYLTAVGSQFPIDSAEATNFFSQIKTLVGQLGRWVDPTDIQAAADEASLDYFANRLPPLAAEAPTTAEFILDADAQTRLRDRSCVRLVIGVDETQETIVSLYHSMRNCRAHHMGVCTCIHRLEVDDENDDEDGSSDGDGNGDSGEEEDSEDEGGMSSFAGGSNVPQCLVFSGSLLQPLMKLYSSYPAYTSVKELIDLGDDETEVRGMLLRLWTEGLLAV